MRDFQAVSKSPNDVNTKQLFPAGEQVNGYSVWPVLCSYNVDWSRLVKENPVDLVLQKPNDASAPASEDRRLSIDSDRDCRNIADVLATR